LGKAVPRGIPLLPRHSTAGATAGVTAFQIQAPCFVTLQTRAGYGTTP